MTPGHPYLIRAMYEWITDNGMTPHVVVDATAPGVMVPPEYVQDGRIVLNIGPSAVHGLHVANDSVDFDARFGGRSMHVHFPPTAALGIYASEMPEVQMGFPRELPGEADAVAEDDQGPGDGDKPKGPKGDKRPSLKVVK
ncbi:MAG: ClpXP protease specificity-enhancing factor [Gammaproteobacteria bacterium]|jgi:stringent starvation protein B